MLISNPLKKLQPSPQSYRPKTFIKRKKSRKNFNVPITFVLKLFFQATLQLLNKFVFSINSAFLNIRLEFLFI
jgi:hypothetical protein